MKADTKKNKEKRSEGLVLGLIFMLCRKIADFFSAGAINRLLTDHDRADKTFRESAAVTVVTGIFTSSKGFFRSLKKMVARQFEESRVMRFSGAAIRKLLSVPGRVYGAFFLTFGTYAVLVYLIKRYALSLTGIDVRDLVCGILLFAFSIPLLLSNRSLVSLLGESVAASNVLTSVFGVATEPLCRIKKIRGSQSVAVVIGIVFGLMTYFVSPALIVAVCIIPIVVVMIMTYPESGVLITIALAPFLGLTSTPSRTLGIMVMLSAVAFAVKLMRGKRVFSWDISEAAVVPFAVALFLSGFAPGGNNTFENAALAISLLIIFFLACNLLKYRKWINATVVAFIAPAVLIGFIGIAEYMLGYAPSGWLDTTLFGEITGRAVSVFGNPNFLGLYLSMMFPLALMLTLPGHSGRVRLLGGISSIVICVCTVFTYSRSAWIGLVVGGLSFAVSVTPNAVIWLIPAAGGTVLGTTLFPDTFGARLFNLASFADSSNNYRVSVWNSVCKMLSDCFVGGVGAGAEAFHAAYLGFAAPGTESVVHSHSLYLQILVQMGAVGLVLFLLAFFAIVRKYRSCCSYDNTETSLKRISSACISGALSLLVAGIFDYTWYNWRIFFLFWALLGVACAAINVRKAEALATTPHMSHDENSSEITVLLSDKNVNNKGTGDIGDE